MPNPASQVVFDYHERTKHHLQRYARSPGTMDWANQPNPFRLFSGTRRTALPLPNKDSDRGHFALYDRSQTKLRPLCLETVSTLMALSMGLSAWKSSGESRWALRMNPSSGNLHPTEAYLVFAPATDLPPGVHHYAPFLHALETRIVPGNDAWKILEGHFPDNGFFVSLTSIFWRESWKYGERALRYCYLDTGHALAAVSVAAGLLGWRVSLLEGVAAPDICRLLGLNRTRFPEWESEHPDLLCRIHPVHSDEPRHDLPEDFLAAVDAAPVIGTPEPLSPHHVNWEIITDTAARIETAAAIAMPQPLPEGRPQHRNPSSLSAAAIIRRRRSATAFNPDHRLEKRRFLDILDKTLPVSKSPVFDVRAGRPNVHLLVFVHRVADLPPGLFLLCRWAEDLPALKNDMGAGFQWAPADDRLPLYRLSEEDVRADAIQASCHQDIAGFSTFSLGMLANFKDPVTANPAAYRQLFRECGMIGQVLYLEAEAQGLRGTGIGCFFDNVVHELAGLKSNRFQSLYHFTIGAPVTDSRIATLPAYHHLKPPATG
ncbi:MAG: SagB family peptide dehydrogenase [Pseudomonadota bacterium]